MSKKKTKKKTKNKQTKKQLIDLSLIIHTLQKTLISSFFFICFPSYTNYVHFESAKWTRLTASPKKIEKESLVYREVYKYYRERKNKRSRDRRESKSG